MARRKPSKKRKASKAPRGRPPVTLKTKGTFESVTRRFLGATKPPGGWPKPSATSEEE